MPRLISSLAGAWLAVAALVAIAVPAQCLASGAAAAEPANAPAAGQLYAQNAARPQSSGQKPPSASRKNPQPQMQGPPQIYFLRGLMNVFSLGMDDFVRKLQADGISANVMNHADSDYVASRIVSTYNSGDRGPIILVGHSLGADAVADIANTLARYNIPIALLVLFDGTEAHQIPGNVTTAINYTRHFMIAAAPGSRGTVQNVDLSNDPGIDHLNIDTAPSLQAQTMNYIIQATSGPPPATTRRQ
jgi:hypothetical protein